MLRWSEEQLAAYRSLQRNIREKTPAPDRPKYRNKKTTIGGITFDSKLESRRYIELKRMEEGAVISVLKLQVPFALVVNGMLICKYVADFTYIDSAGRFVVEDAKGMRTRDYLLKKKLMKAVHDIDITEFKEQSRKKNCRKNRNAV